MSAVTDLTTQQLILALALLNVAMGLGWGWTLHKSMQRSLTMYEFGRQNGVEQGIHQGRAEAKKSKRRKR